MSRIFLSAVLPFAALQAVAAQQPSASPADPQAAAPPARYQSVFSSYTPYQEPGVAPWRALNDEVGRIGGHIGIMGGAGGHASGAGLPAVTTQDGQPPIRTAPNAPAASPHAH